MKFQTLDSLKVKTPQGEMELKAGQVITLPHELAIKLINKGKIAPIEKVAYKVYSELLGCFLWVVDTNEDMWILRTEGITETIYANDEIQRLKKLPKKALKEINKAKEIFSDARVEDVETGEH